MDETILIKITLVLVMVIWGGSFIASSMGLDGLYPVELATLRFTIAVPILLGMTILLKGVKSLIIDPKDLPVLTVLALTGVTLQYIVQFMAMTYTTVTNTALLINLGTIFVVISSALLLKEKLKPDNIMGIALAFMGTALVATKGDFAISPNIIGDTLVIFCAVMWAIYLLTGNKLAGKYSVLTQLNYIFIIGWICLLPAYFLTPHHALSEINTLSWTCIAYLAILCSVVAYFLFNDALIKIGPSKTAIYQYFEPFFAIIFAIALIGEPLTMIVATGALLIVIGVAMADNNIKILGHIFKENIIKGPNEERQ